MIGLDPYIIPTGGTKTMQFFDRLLEKLKGCSIYYVNENKEEYGPLVGLSNGYIQFKND